MKRIIGIIIGAALLIGCGQEPTTVATGPVGVACANMTVEVDGQLAMDRCAALTGGASGGSVTYFELSDNSGVYGSDGTNYRMEGPAASYGDRVFWTYGEGTAGPRIGRRDWISFTLPVYGANGTNCIDTTTQAFQDMTPFTDTSTFKLQADPTGANYDGQWRPWGNYTGVDVLYRVSAGYNYLIGVKVANTRGNLGACNVLGGPGAIGDVALIYLPSNI